MQEIMGAAYAGGSHVTLPAWRAEGDEEAATVAGSSRDDERWHRVEDDAVREVVVRTNEEDPRWRKVCVDGSIVELPLGGSMRVRTLERGPFRVLVDRVVEV